MGRFLVAVAAALLLAGTTLASGSLDQGRGNRHKHDRDGGRGDNRPDSSVAVHVAFGAGDDVVLRNHYGPKYRNLPPGLQKKLARGGQLPPGWQKKFAPFPVAVERQLHPLPHEYRRGVIDGHAVIYNARTNVIVDVAVLF